jgi:hypothetical protein
VPHSKPLAEVETGVAGDRARACLYRTIGFRQFVWLWNRCQGQTMPPLHIEIAEWLERRWRADERRLVLLVFRSAGKSTLVGIFCAWLLLNDPDLRILVLAAEHDLARKMVRNVKRIIERVMSQFEFCRP